MRSLIKIGMTLPSMILAGAGMSAGAVTVTTVVNNGPPMKRVDVVVMGDRYTAADMVKFRNDVNRVIASMRQASPWSQYWGYVNVHRVEVESTSSAQPGPLRSTLSGGRCWFADQASVLRYAALAPDNQVRIVLVNNSTYGGCATYGGIAVAYNGTYLPDVAVHETGHQYGSLADEYDYSGGATYTGSEPFEANVTKETNRSLLKWRLWVNASTALPTPDTAGSGVIGAYQGARYCTHGIYRPKPGCLMRQLGAPYCEVCREKITKTFYQHADPVAAVTSSTGSFRLTNASSITLGYRHSAPNAVRQTWSLDGVERGTSPTFDLSGAGLAAGAHAVTLKMTDLTPFVRTGAAEKSVTVVVTVQ